MKWFFLENTQRGDYITGEKCKFEYFGNIMRNPKRHLLLQLIIIINIQDIRSNGRGRISISSSNGLFLLTNQATTSISHHVSQHSQQMSTKKRNCFI